MAYKEDSNQAIKGDIGEKIIDETLFKKGYQLYGPTFNEAHSFDILIFSKRKNRFYLSDVKTKPSRVYYPDTGIDYKHYMTYKKKAEQLNMDFLLLFVDETKKEIYGNLLSILEEEITIQHKNKNIIYPKIEQKKDKIIYFPLEKMIKIASISDEDAKKIWNHSTMNEKYKKQQNNTQENTNKGNFK